MFSKSTLSACKCFGAACFLLVACGRASAQKKTNDPYAGMPPMPAPKLLTTAPAQSSVATNEVMTSPVNPVPGNSAETNPVAAYAATNNPMANTPVADVNPAAAASAPATEMVNPAAAFAAGASSPAAAPTTPASSASKPAPYSAMAPSTGLTHSSLLSINDYEHLLDIVLPADHRTRPGLEYSLILRFEPHIHPESQIMIRRWRDGRIETAVYRVQERNAWQAAYGRVVPGQTPDFDAVAKDVKVDRKSFQLASADEAAWRKELMPAIQKELAAANKKIKHIDREGVHELEMNGTRYELWYIQGDNEMHFTSLDSEVDTMTHGNLQLTKWMNQVRSYADSHSTDYKPLMFSPDEAKTPRTLLSKNNKKNKKDLE